MLAGCSALLGKDRQIYSGKYTGIYNNKIFLIIVNTNIRICYIILSKNLFMYSYRIEHAIMISPLKNIVRVGNNSIICKNTVYAIDIQRKAM